MCGRTVLSLSKEQLQCACSYKSDKTNKYVKAEWLHEHNDGKEYIPSHNIAPTDVTPVLVSANKYRNGAKNEHVLKPMMWGIIPPWHMEDYRTHKLSTNNCRLENIKSSRLYNPILRNGGRCIIVVEGFYEWQTTEKTSKTKQPYYIYMPQEEKIEIDECTTWNNTFEEAEGWKGICLMQIAGLYNVWQNEDKVIYSYSIITMDSNSTLSWLHHRMPAILNTQDQAWLDINNVEADMALSYLKPITLLSWHPVSTLVNNSRNKSENCNKKILIDRKKTTQKTLNEWFNKTAKRKSDDNDCSEHKKAKQ
ncbi:abasic site processing protein HMCES isoform X2 [Galleria mellonella]|uniref:Abasic site processing protein HMCES n=1 Tax=Galleria mellonella TaxID=7137 RepID=A0A6J1X561_GALME|nr:abasic site processing protein HMCES isoform X2 [Galleria mellonella]